MRTVTTITYQCEHCKKEYETKEDAYLCEATHFGLTVEQYKEYLNLLDEERNAYCTVSITNNDITRAAVDKATQDVLSFQKLHNMNVE